MYLASAEAARRGEDSPDTVDMLVGMLREADGIAGRVLAYDSVEVDLVLGARDSVCGEPDVSLADVESRSLIEAAWLHHSYAGTEHLLLAVCCLNKHPVQICWFVLQILGHFDEWERWLAEHPDVARGHNTTALRSMFRDK
jgi:hypothetical protein